MSHRHCYDNMVLLPPSIPNLINFGVTARSVQVGTFAAAHLIAAAMDLELGGEATLLLPICLA